MKKRLQVYLANRAKKFSVPGIILKVMQKVNETIEPSKTLRILDIGAGGGAYWNDKYFSQFFLNRKTQVTLFDAAEESQIPNPKSCNIILNKFTGFAPDDLSCFAESEFDLVIALDLIEHLSREAGYKLLYEIDRISSHTSLIFTPNGFVWQPPATNNPLNAHISGWTPGELKKLGWREQYGNTGLKYLIGPYGIPRFRIPILNVFNVMLLPVVRRIPSLAFNFTAIKKEKNIWMKKQTF